MKFLKAWVEKIADEIYNNYEMESPNRGSSALLFKLDHIRMKNDEVMDGKCIICASPGWTFNMMFENCES